MLQHKVAAIKESIAQNQASVRQYTWTAHTEISVKGEVKNEKDELCKYGPDGQGRQDAGQKAQKEQPADPQQAATKQKVVAALKNDPKMREQFLNKVAAPIANKLFECGMVP